MGRCIFTGANLLDGDRAARPDATVVVEGEHISRVIDGPAKDLRPDDRVIDLAGRTLMPGLVLCHFHGSFFDFTTGSAPAIGLEHTPAIMTILTEKHVKLALDCGFTSVVSASCPDRIDASIRDAINLGLVPGPRFWAASHELCSAGDVIDAQNRLWHYGLGSAGTTRVANGPEGFRSAVREEIAWGADIVKVNASGGHGVAPAGEQMSIAPEELRAAAEAAHLREKKIRAHAASKRAVLECARAGFDVIDHADRMDAECIDAILEAGSIVVPSMFYTQRFLSAMEAIDFENEEQAMRGMPRIESPRAIVERIRGVREDFDYTRRILPEAHAAGVPMVIGDDYGTAVLRQGEFAAELEFYVKDVGIAPLDVIRWATRNGAELMDRGAELGTVAEGKLADLLVVDGDPLADIGCLQDRERLLAIVKGGLFVKDGLAGS